MITAKVATQIPTRVKDEVIKQIKSSEACVKFIDVSPDLSGETIIIWEARIDKLEACVDAVGVIINKKEVKKDGEMTLEDIKNYDSSEHSENSSARDFISKHIINRPN
jgi:hypothetical protein